MITQTPAEIWTIIISLGVLTFAIRFSFLGLMGERNLPNWVQRHLRYTAVAVLPALITPLVLWPEAKDGALDAIWIAACVTTLAIGYLSRNSVWAIAAGFASYYALNAIF